MKKVLIQRIESGDEGTFGRLTVGGLSLFTGELPWRENQNNISCIPPGLYHCTWTLSPRFKRHMYLVGPVPQRSGIRKHSANFMGDAELGFRKQLNGCISLGEKLGWMNGQKALLLSAPAIRRFESYMEFKPFLLEIKDVG